MEKKKRGRPLGSIVRQNMIEILYFYDTLHGYELSKIYNDIYAPVTLRLIYYHLSKGIQLGIFSVKKVEHKSGNYSWGENVQNILYTLGTNAKPVADKNVKNYKEKHKK